MNNQPRGNASGGTPPGPQSQNRTMLKIFLGLLVVAAVAWLALVLTDAAKPSDALVTVGGAFVILAAITDATMRHKRQARQRSPFSLDDIRQRVDSDALRQLRDSKGEVPAVKELRKQVPEASLLDATKVIRSL
ncbi:hypothetical protein GCM10012287_20990 [Streptomyces daqingensis]|uniref:Uncharacterized protein n=2 Tax=Streptomyces daqingensis TaxID=1472640 RepID=A0ABQ2M6P3_9ACTN|nr:hypothetical protein GCM10012287_20990 [Streptomyces daqingensis]